MSAALLVDMTSGLGLFYGGTKRYSGGQIEAVWKKSAFSINYHA